MKRVFLTICVIITVLLITGYSSNKHLGGQAKPDPQPESKGSAVELPTGSEEIEADDSDDESSATLKDPNGDNLLYEFDPIPADEVKDWIKKQGLVLDNDLLGDNSYIYGATYMCYLPYELTPENFFDVFIQTHKTTICTYKRDKEKMYAVAVGDTDRILSEELIYGLLSAQTVEDAEEDNNVLTLVVVVGPSDEVMQVVSDFKNGDY